MATISQIDRNRALRIYPTRTGADLVSKPDVECSITFEANETQSVLDWLSACTYKALFERNLQALSATTSGEPLLTTWFTLDEFEAIASGADLPASLQALKGFLAEWRRSGMTDVYVDGYRATTPFDLDELSGHAFIFAPPGNGRTFLLTPSTR